jgi:hypothetical protein
VALVLGLRARVVGPSVLGLALMSAMACGPGSQSLEGGVVDAGPLATAKDFCREVWAQYAISEARCYGGAPSDWASATALETCSALDALKTTIRYERDKASACLDELKARVATECYPMLDCLDQVVVGLVANGQPCTHSAECGHNVTCLRADDTTCGRPVCTPLPALGAPCEAACAPGGVCDLATMTCVAAVVTLRGEPCEQDWDCALEDFCDTTCKPRLPVGASCARAPTGCVPLAACDFGTSTCVAAGRPSQRCGLGGFCLDGFCIGDPAAEGLCSSPLGLGAPCFSGAQCSTGVCGGSVMCTACPR